MMQRCESHESEVQRSPSLDSVESEFTRAARRGHRLAVGAFYGSRGSNVKDQTALNEGAVVAVPPGGKPQDKRVSARGKYVVFYLDLSFVLLLEFEKLKMARGCLCCVKYMMFLFNLLFWVSIKLQHELSKLTCTTSLMCRDCCKLVCVYHFSQKLTWCLCGTFETMRLFEWFSNVHFWLRH